MDKAFTVTELTKTIKKLLETNLDEIRLQGEISNLALPTSGHAYFAVKDENAQISAVMFRTAFSRIPFELEKGLEVVLVGRITLYEPRGVYQIIVERIEPVGSGALELAFQQLKSKLEQEGLFDKTKKQEIPFLPKTIGIITSPTGAVIQDILNILNRRFSNIPVIINPVSVQGEKAGFEIAQAIKELHDFPEIDLIILARGGGSLEDLWAFNEEIVARAIFAAKIPVISAVGHETDFTIADFTADLRAPTPSVAAELAVPLKSDLLYTLKEQERKLEILIKGIIQRFKDSLISLTRLIKSPDWVIQSHMIKTDDLSHRLIRAITDKITYNKNKVGELSHVLSSLNPLSIINRGFATVSDSNGNLITSIKKVKNDMTCLIQVADGVIQSRVEKTLSNKSSNNINLKD